MAEIVFHSMAESAYLWTAMHVADEKGVAYDFTPLVYRSPEHLKLNPLGKMPIMQHGTLFLYETLAIAHYIDKAFGGPPLQPGGPAAQAEVLKWVSIVNAYIFPTMNRFMKERIVKPQWGTEPDRAFMAEAKEPLALQIRLIDEAVGRHAFLAGDSLSIADSFLLPHLLFFGLTPEGAALIGGSRAIAAWFGRMRARPSYTKSPMATAFEAMGRLPAPKELAWS
jgi:glutathione S-transferase